MNTRKAIQRKREIEEKAQENGDDTKVIVTVPNRGLTRMHIRGRINHKVDRTIAESSAMIHPRIKAPESPKGTDLSLF